MINHNEELRLLLVEPEPAGDSYFGNPYHLGLEQYGLEHLDRNEQGAGDIESVVILGYN